MVKGIVVKSKKDTHDHCEFEHMAVSLLPTPFPLRQYDQAKRMQDSLGLLLSKMIKDPAKYIYPPLDYFYRTDPFIKRLVDISKTYHACPHPKQTL